MAGDPHASIARVWLCPDSLGLRDPPHPTFTRVLHAPANVQLRQQEELWGRRHGFQLGFRVNIEVAA